MISGSTTVAIFPMELQPLPFAIRRETHMAQARMHAENRRCAFDLRAPSLAFGIRVPEFRSRRK